MRICFIGEYSPVLDEGMRNVTFHLAQELSRSHQVLTLDIKKVFTPHFWIQVKRFNPQIIHYVHGPTIKSFLLVKILSLYCRSAKTVMSAMRPYLSSLSVRFIPWLKPDLILTQSHETESKFCSLRCRTEFLPCGVDTEKFTPVSPKVKMELRGKYSVDNDKFILLHVGSIKPGRGVQLLVELQGVNSQVIVVGPTSVGTDNETQRQLEDSGCLVWAEYFENINEIYALADCYIYPTVSLRDTSGRAVTDSIEMPLSVLEAMSCNLPVVSTKFGALARVFAEGGGLTYFGSKADFLTAIEQVRRGIEVKLREKVLAYSWERVSIRLSKLYAKILEEG